MAFERVPELYAAPNERAELLEKIKDMPSIDLTPRQLCDLELLMNGGFAPLTGFLGKADYDSVVETMRLSSGALWPMPITLDVTEKVSESLALGDQVVLRDQEGVPLAVMDVEEMFTPDKHKEAEMVYGADDMAHPAVRYLHNQTGNVYLGGPVTGIDEPVHYDYRQHRYTPNDLRRLFHKWGWRKVVAFQTRNPLHRAHVELTVRAAQMTEANLLIHPVVGMTKPGDVDHFTRVRCYEAVMRHYPDQTTAMALLHLAMRMAGPREALW
ncbi:MAG: adenylyltransferase, partial [Alphaproteobacteria bacterium]